MIITASLALLTTAAIVLSPSTKDLSRFASRVASYMPTSEPDTLSHFVQYFQVVEDDREFWEVSRKLKGMFSRFLRSLLFLALIHALYKHRRLTTQQLLGIVKLATLQLWFSIMGVPEAVLCLFIPMYPHIAARTAVSFYNSLINQCCLLWSENAEQTSMPNLEFLL